MAGGPSAAAWGVRGVLNQAIYGRAIRADEPMVRVMKRPVLTRRSVMGWLRVDYQILSGLLCDN